VKRILLVPDTLNWAWASMARGIAKHAPDGYDVRVVDQTDFGALTRPALQFVLEEFDAVCQFSWTECPIGSPSKPMPIKRMCTVVASHGIEFDVNVDAESVPERIATRLRNKESAKERLPRFANVLCVSRRLHELASKLCDNAMLATPGVDLAMFYPIPLPLGEKLRVGWCGQRQDDPAKDVKGFREILLPLIDKLRDRVQFIVNPRTAKNALPHAEMVAWYKGLDCVISTSCSEGCQMPLLEAAACGRAAIATDVGAASELIDDKQSGILIPSWRTKDDAKARVDTFADVLLSLDDRRNDVERMGENAAAKAAACFNWAQRAPEWLRLIGGEG
jgi:hypothetical protein